MAKKKSNGWNLGLHTLEEQSLALQMALQAIENANRGLETANMDAVWHSVGYLAAIRDLANAEGAPGLAKNVEDLLSRFIESSGLQT